MKTDFIWHHGLILNYLDINGSVTLTNGVLDVDPIRLGQVLIKQTEPMAGLLLELPLICLVVSGSTWSVPSC